MRRTLTCSGIRSGSTIYWNCRLHVIPCSGREIDPYDPDECVHIQFLFLFFRFLAVRFIFSPFTVDLSGVISRNNTPRQRQTVHVESFIWAHFLMSPCKSIGWNRSADIRLVFTVASLCINDTFLSLDPQTLVTPFCYKKLIILGSGWMASAITICELGG